MAPSTADKPAYLQDEKALCFHGELLYEAKIMNIRRQNEKDKTSPWEYRVHYKGWKNTWDDWVPQDRLRKNTEESRELAANLKKSAQEQAAKPSKSSTVTKSRKSQSDFASARGSEERTSSIPARGTKRARDNDIEKDFKQLFKMSIDHSSGSDSVISIPGSFPEESSPLDILAEAASTTTEVVNSSNATSQIETTAIAAQVLDTDSGAVNVNHEDGATRIESAAHMDDTLVPETTPVDEKSDSSVLASEHSDDGASPSGEDYETPITSESNTTPPEAPRLTAQISALLEALIPEVPPPRRTWHRDVTAGFSMPIFMKQYVSMHKDEVRNYATLCEIPERREDYIDYLNRGQPEQHQLRGLVWDELQAIARAPKDEPEYKVSRGPAFAPLIGGTAMGEQLRVNEALSLAFDTKSRTRSARAQRETEEWTAFYPPMVKIAGLSNHRVESNNQKKPKSTRAGVAKNPINLDPAGSGGPFDRDNFPGADPEQGRLTRGNIQDWCDHQRVARISKTPREGAFIVGKSATKSAPATKRKLDTIAEDDENESAPTKRQKSNSTTTTKVRSVAEARKPARNGSRAPSHGPDTNAKVNKPRKPSFTYMIVVSDSDTPSATPPAAARGTKRTRSGSVFAEDDTQGPVKRSKSTSEARTAKKARNKTVSGVKTAKASTRVNAQKNRAVRACDECRRKHARCHHNGPEPSKSPEPDVQPTATTNPSAQFQPKSNSTETDVNENVEDDGNDNEAKSASQSASLSQIPDSSAITTNNATTTSLQPVASTQAGPTRPVTANERVAQLKALKARRRGNAEQ